MGVLWGVEVIAGGGAESCSILPDGASTSRYAVWSEFASMLGMARAALPFVGTRCSMLAVELWPSLALLDCVVQLSPGVYLSERR